MLLTQEPTFIMVDTQEPTTHTHTQTHTHTHIYIYKREKKIAATHAFQNHEMIYYYIPSSCNAELQSQK